MTDSPMIPVYLGWFPAQAVATAIELERALIAGRTMGLTEAEAREVIDVCLAVGTSWQDIRTVMTRRAMGMEWKV